MLKWCPLSAICTRVLSSENSFDLWRTEWLTFAQVPLALVELQVSFGPWRRPNVRRGTHQRQDACNSDRLTRRRRSELQVRRIAHFLDCRPVPRRQSQLVRVVAIFVYISADAYTRDELIELENWILAAWNPHLDIHSFPFFGACWMREDAVQDSGTSLSL